MREYAFVGDPNPPFLARLADAVPVVTLRPPVDLERDPITGYVVAKVVTYEAYTRRELHGCVFYAQREVPDDDAWTAFVAFQPGAATA